MKRISILLIVCSCSLFAKSPKTDIDLIFSHKFHMDQVGAACTDCHEGVVESIHPADILSPSMDLCYTCHDEEETACTYCHKDPDTAGSYSTALYISKFPHAQHIEKMNCEHCHAGVSQSETVALEHMPAMMTCQTGCHDDLQQPDYCMTCHAKGEDLAPADHNMNWLNAHGLTTQMNQDECKACHVEQQCLDCHTGDNLDRKVHPLNFINNHAIAAKGKTMDCYTCHEEQAFCSTCHKEQLVLPRNHNTAGWANPSTGGRHAREARMDLDNCIACHNEQYGEPICAKCHGSKN